MSYFVFYWLFSCRGSITSVMEERANFSALFTCNCVITVRRGLPLPLDAWDGLHYFIVALPGSSI